MLVGRGGSSGEGPGSGGSAALCRRDGPVGGRGGGGGGTRSQDADVVRGGGGGADRTGARVLYSQDWILLGGSDPASLPTPLSFRGLSVSRLSIMSLSSSTSNSCAVEHTSGTMPGSGEDAEYSCSGTSFRVGAGAETGTGTGAAVTAVTGVGIATLGPVSFLASTGLGGSGGGLGLVAGLGAAAAGSVGAREVVTAGAGAGAAEVGGAAGGATDGAAGGAAFTASAGAIYSSGARLAAPNSLRGWPSKLRDDAEETSLGGRGGGRGRGKFSGIISEKFSIICWYSAPFSTAGMI